LKHFLILLTVGLVTLTIVFIIYRPDLVEKVWLWVIGLAGPVFAWLRKIIQLIRTNLLPKVKSIQRIPRV
jgi:hypothetical protein